MHSYVCIWCIIIILMQSILDFGKKKIWFLKFCYMIQNDEYRSERNAKWNMVKKRQYKWGTLSYQFLLDWWEILAK